MRNSEQMRMEQHSTNTRAITDQEKNRLLYEKPEENSERKKAFHTGLGKTQGMK